MTAYRSNGGVLVPLETVRSISQPILYFDEDRLNRFVELMKENHEFPPIQVQELEGGYYRVMDGHHRFVASQRCSFTQIPIETIPKL
jgi:ParB-like chromosome segregation protein Spo0J